MRLYFRRMAQDQSGATSIEYGLIASLVCVVVISSVAILGDRTTGLYARVTSTIGPALDKALGGGGADGPGDEDQASP